MGRSETKLIGPPGSITASPIATHRRACLPISSAVSSGEIASTSSAVTSGASRSPHALFTSGPLLELSRSPDS